VDDPALGKFVERSAREEPDSTSTHPVTTLFPELPKESEKRLVAAKATGVSVENTMKPIKVTEVTFLNFSKNEIFIKKGNKKICYSLFSYFLKYYNQHILDYL
jgi:hypothetical protein